MNRDIFILSKPFVLYPLCYYLYTMNNCKFLWVTDRFLDLFDLRLHLSIGVAT